MDQEQPFANMAVNHVEALLDLHLVCVGVCDCSDRKIENFILLLFIANNKSQVWRGSLSRHHQDQYSLVPPNPV